MKTESEEMYCTAKSVYEKSVAIKTSENTNILSTIESHQCANINYLEEGTKMFELSQHLYSLYVTNNFEQNRQLLNFLCSNFILNDLSLCATYRQPFDLLAKGLSRSVWLGREELNPHIVSQSHVFYH